MESPRETGKLKEREDRHLKCLALKFGSDIEITSMATPTLNELEKAFDTIVAKNPIEPTSVNYDDLIFVLENTVGVTGRITKSELQEGLEAYKLSINPKYEIDWTGPEVILISLRA